MKTEEHKEIERLESLISDLKLLSQDMVSPVAIRFNEILIGEYQKQLDLLRKK